MALISLLVFDTPILFFDVLLFYYLAIIVDFINGGANDVFDQCPTRYQNVLSLTQIPRFSQRNRRQVYSGE